jgi:predicted ATPase/class 3 adenylate cyclase
VTGTYALLFTDLVDSTRLSEQLGDAAMASLWARHDALARDLLRVHRGKEIDKSDGFLLLFGAANDAVRYAVAYHRALALLDPPLQTRAGLHVGDIILVENAPEVVALGAKPLEVHGLAKPVAARVMSLALGGQTLLTDAARNSLGPTALRLASHGHWRMKGIAQPIELFQVGDADALFAPPPDAPKAYRVAAHGDLWLPVKQVDHSLPAERDAFIGRTADLRALTQRIEQGAALVSVLGMGGSGKTRLVTRYGWSSLGDYPGGVWFGDLSEARTVEGIAQAVARALDVELVNGDPIAQLGHAIAGRGRCLVLLDNFEQVARHAGETLGRWLDRAPDTQFLVTSREVLGLPGEETLALAPLRPSDGAALFVARARSAKRDFELDDVASVEALVKLLDGLPLAIELAAARVRVMPPKTLLQRMGERFKLLASSGGRHTRQATLRATLDWSWDLLSPDEQRALAQLSVFEGGFTLEAAEAVLALPDMWPTDAVQALVDKSLVRAVSDGRFDLLVSVHEYAAEKRRGFGAPDEAEIRHEAWFARLGTPQAADSLQVRSGIGRAVELGRELDNLIAACGRAVMTGDDSVAVGLLEAAWLGALQHDHGRDGQHDVADDGAVKVGNELGNPVNESGHLAYLGILHHNQGRLDEAMASYGAALVVAREIGDRRREAQLLDNVGALHGDRGRPHDARACYRAALTLAREVGDRRLESIVLGDLGHLLRFLGEHETAARHLATALALHREMGAAHAEPDRLGDLALIEAVAGRHESALSLALEAVAIAAPFPTVERDSLETLARVHLARGDVSEAREAVARARALAPKRVAKLAAVDALVAVAEGDRAAAEAALAEATAEPTQCLPGTEVAQLIDRARAAMEAQ